MRMLATLMLALLAGLSGCGRPDRTGAVTPVTAATSARGPVEPVQLGLCATCHGRDGIARVPNAPHLAGRDRQELLAAMQAFLDGRRDYAPMRALLGPLRPDDRERLADWYAAQPKPVPAVAGEAAVSAAAEPET